MANYMAIKTNDINNGPGLRVSFWFSGCHFMCEECHNKEAWDFNAGELITTKVLFKLIHELESPHLNLSILGGEPFHPKNRHTLLNIVYAVKSRYPNKNIWVWTGYDLIDLLYGDDNLLVRDILEHVDTVVDGKFDKSLTIGDTKYKGSTNQNIYTKEMIEDLLYN